MQCHSHSHKRVVTSCFCNCVFKIKVTFNTQYTTVHASPTQTQNLIIMSAMLGIVGKVSSGGVINIIVLKRLGLK